MEGFRHSSTGVKEDVGVWVFTLLLIENDYPPPSLIIVWLHYAIFCTSWSRRLSLAEWKGFWGDSFQQNSLGSSMVDNSWMQLVLFKRLFIPSNWRSCMHWFLSWILKMPMIKLTNPSFIWSLSRLGFPWMSHSGSCPLWNQPPLLSWSMGLHLSFSKGHGA